MGLVESRLYALEFLAACQKAESSQIDGRAVPFLDPQTVDILRRAWTCLSEDAKKAIVDKNEQASSQPIQRPEKRRKAVECSAPSKRRKQKGDRSAISSHGSAHVHLDFESWFKDPLSFFQTDAALDWEHNSVAALYLSGAKLGLGPRSKIDTMRLRLIKVVFYHLKIKYGSDHLRYSFLELITDIVKLSRAVDLDEETVNKTLNRWIDDGHRVDLLCQSLGMSNGKYLGHIFGSLGSASNEDVRVIPLKGEERNIKIQALRKYGQPDERTNSLASTIFFHVWRLLDQRMREALGDKAWEYQYDPLICTHTKGNNVSTEEATLAPQSPEGPHGQDCDVGVRRPDSAQHLSDGGGVSSLLGDGYDPLRYINSIEPNLPASPYDPLRDINPVENGHVEGAYAFNPLRPVNGVRPQLQEHHGHLRHMNSVDSNQLENGYNPLHYVNPVEVGLAEDGHDPFHFLSPVGSDLPESGYNPLHYVNPVEVGVAEDVHDPLHFLSPVGSDLPESGYNPLHYVNPVEVGVAKDVHDPLHFLSPVGPDLREGGYNPLHYVNPVEPDFPRNVYDPVYHISPVELQASVAPVNMDREEDLTQRFGHSSYSHGMPGPRQIRSLQHSTNGSTTFRVIPVT